MIIVQNILFLLSSCCSVQCCRAMCVEGAQINVSGHRAWSLPLPCSQPPHCVPDTYSNATLWYKIFTTARDANTKYAQDYNPFWCYKGAIGKVYHALNPKLTVIVPDVSETGPSALSCVSVTVCVCVHAHVSCQGFSENQRGRNAVSGGVYHLSSRGALQRELSSWLIRTCLEKSRALAVGCRGSQQLCVFP